MSSLFSFGRRSPKRRSSPDEYGYNVGCLEGINPFDIGEVPVNDGVNHPAGAKRP